MEEQDSEKYPGDVISKDGQEFEKYPGKGKQRYWDCAKILTMLEGIPMEIICFMNF